MQVGNYYVIYCGFTPSIININNYNIENINFHCNALIIVL